MDSWIQVFRTGRHTDASGDEREWGIADLDRIISSYNPLRHEAPVVIGHPEDSAPAFGWVEALKRDGEILYAKLKNMVPEFVDMVRRGLYKKRSIALYPDLTLRHVGFLGAMPPSIKGLEDVRFYERAKNIICFSDIEWKGGMELSLSKSPRKERARAIGNKLVSLAEEKMKADKRLTYGETMIQVQRENRELISELAQQPSESPGPKMNPRQERARAIGYKIVSLVEGKMKADKRLSYSAAMAQVQKENRELILEFIRE